MDGSQGDSQLATGKHHAPGASARELREQLGMTGEMMPRAIPYFLADRRGNNAVDLASLGHLRGVHDIIERRFAAGEIGFARYRSFVLQLARLEQPDEF